MMGGMDDMNTPIPPMDAGQDMMPPEGGDQDPMGGEELPMDDAGAPQDDMGGEMPMESRFNFKRIIDEIFNDDSKSVFAGTDRPQKKVGEDALTDCDDPFLPR